MRSSTSAGSRPGTRATASRTAPIASASGGVSWSAPRGALPTAVRTALTMTASLTGSRMAVGPWSLVLGPRSVPERLAGFQGVADPVAGEALSEQPHERLPLQVQKVCRGQECALRDVAAAHHAGQGEDDRAIVLAHLAGEELVVGERLGGRDTS